MAESASAWQAQQKEKATNTQIKKPNIPGDYGGQQIPPVPNTEGFSGEEGYRGVTWFALIGGAGAILLLVALRQRLK